MAFPALFSIVNQIGSALIFTEATQGRSGDARRAAAIRIGAYALLVLLASLWYGYVPDCFGVSLSALRIAGELLVSVQAFRGPRWTGGGSNWPIVVSDGEGEPR